MDKKRLIIIDSNAIIHRAFHALPPLTTKKGEAIGAVYGFLLFFFKALKEFKPDFIVATFDFPAPTFRHKEYDLYKATRKKAPDDLYSQIPKTKEVMENFNVQVFEKQGYEADDIIGTVSELVKNRKPVIETIILTGDTDTFQLIDKNTKVYTLKRGIKDAVLYGEQEIKEKYGLDFSQLVDFKALRGDPADNIPGVPGIGEKTAILLIKEFGTLENLYKELEKNNKKIKEAIKEKLIAGKEKAILSKMLSKIDVKVPIDFDLEKCEWKNYNKEKAKEILNHYEFFSLIKRLEETEEKHVSAPVLKNKKENSNLILF